MILPHNASSSTGKNLSKQSEKVLNYFEDHYSRTGKVGVYKNQFELSEEIGLETSQISDALRALENENLVGIYQRTRYGVPYLHLTEKYLNEKYESSVTTTTTPNRFDQN